MKLRQKLAMVLASAMIVTAVPVTTMAASTNSFSKTISVAEGTVITTTNNMLDLIVDYTDAVAADEFYLVAKDFDFDKDAYGTGIAIYSDLAHGTQVGTVTYDAKDQLTVKLNHTAAVDKLYIPIAGKVKKGTPSITVDAAGSFATNSTLTFGEVTSSKTLVATTVKEADVNNLSVVEGGTLSDITIEEKVADELKGQVITITLPNSSDVEFASQPTLNQKVTFSGKRGLSGFGTPTLVREDEKTLKITMPATGTNKIGSLVISGIEVVPEGREDLKEAKVEVTVKGDKMDTTKLIVGQVVENGATLKVEEVKKLTAGGSTEKVKVTLKETIKGSINRPVYFTIEGAEFAETTTTADMTFTNTKKKDELVIDPSAIVDGKFEQEFEIYAESATEGDVVLTASSKNLKDDLTVKVAEVSAPVTVEAEGFQIKAGVKGQKGGKIVITETDAEKLAKNKEIRIKSDDDALTITDADVKVTDGDIKVESEVKDGEIIIKVNRSSGEASDITITNIAVKADKNLAEGDYDFLVGGDAISTANTTAKKEYKDVIKVKKFLTTSEAEKVVEIGEGAEVYLNEDNRMMAKLRVVSEAFGVEPTFNHNADGVGVITFFTADRGIIQFTNGSSSMSINGVEVPMDTATVIKEDGYTYVPARYLAEALGLTVEWDETTRVATFATK